MKKFTFSICAIAKEEHRYLEDWVASNMATGAEHFFLYDNGSSIPVARTLHKFIAAGFVTVTDFPGYSVQMPSYTHCLYNFGHRSKWIGFIDCDEILVPQKAETVQEVLKEYEKYGGLSVCQRMFGSSGHQTPPETGLMMENYLMALPKDHELNTRIKGIVQPKRTVGAGPNPHCFVFKPGQYSVTENLTVVPDNHVPYVTHSSEKIQVNHYFTKSYGEWRQRIMLPRVDWQICPRLPEVAFFGLEELATERDESALRFADKAKRVMQAIGVEGLEWVSRTPSVSQETGRESGSAALPA